MSLIKNLLIEAQEVTLQPIHPTQCIGTSKKLQFNHTFQQLVDRIGQPILHPSGSDIKVEWCFKATCGDGSDFIVSIYNDPHYYDHIQPHEMENWCIGCDTKYHATIILMYLGR